MIVSSVHYLLRRHAVAGKLQRAVRNSYNTATSEVSQLLESCTVRLVFADTVWTRSLNQLIAKGRQRIIVPAQDLGFEPQIADHIVYKNSTYAILDVTTVRDGEALLAYVCEVAHDS